MGSHDEDMPEKERMGYTRGELLTRAGGAAFGVTALGGVLAACGTSTNGSSTTTGAPGTTSTGASGGAIEGTVAFLGWQGYDDRKAAAPVLKQGVKLATTYITNNDQILTKLRSGGLGSTDVVTPYFGYIKPMVEANLIQPIDYDRLPSTKTFLPEFYKNEWNTVDGKVYSAPMVWADTPLIYRPDRISTPPSSYRDLAKPEFKDKLVTLDDALSNIIIFAKVALGTQTPTQISKADLKKAMAFGGTIRPNIVTVSASFGDILDILLRGDAAMCVTGWAFLKAQAAQKGRKLLSATPKEGSFSWFDNYCIPRDAPNLDATYAFIDAMVSARGDATLGENTGSAVANKASIPLLPKAQRKLYPYDGISEYFETNGLYGLPPLEAEGDTATFGDWQTAWQQFKSA